jgi:cob(I)alamin adenosyltransferase
VGKVVAAEHNENSQLVLVNTEFNRVSDTLFVVLNRSNEIISVDFPQDPIRPRPVASPIP